MGGSSERGGVNYWLHLTVQQQQRGPQLSTPTMEGVSERGGVNHRRLTDQQQQQRTQPSASPQATHAFDIYLECVVAGQWARFSVEQRPDGEYISLFSRPPAAAAARCLRKPSRPPNMKRAEKQKRWRENCSSKHAADTPNQQQQ